MGMTSRVVNSRLWKPERYPKMDVSLKCFCDFHEAKTLEQRKRIARRYRKGTTQRSKGMIVYYGPALQLMRGRLCPDGNMDQKIAALRKKCLEIDWTEKLLDACIEANALVFRAFHDHFGAKKLRVFPSPRLRCAVADSLSVNLQPELYAEVDGVRMIWKLHMSKKSPRKETIGHILQMLNMAVAGRGLNVPIQQICFFELRTGRIYVQSAVDDQLKSKLGPTAAALAEAWEAAA